MASNSAPAYNVTTEALRDIAAKFSSYAAVDAFTDSTKTLYESKEYSDFVLTCRGRLYRLHKSIVCPRSPVFAAMLRSPLQEGQNNTINLPDDDVLAVHCVVRYFYFLTYDPDDQMDADGFEYHEASDSATPSNVADSDKLKESNESKPTATFGRAPILQPHHALELHAHVYVLADRYDVAALKKSALGKFKKALRSHWDADGFVAAAHIAYEWTSEVDTGLRESVLDAAFKHRLKLLNDPHLREDLQGSGSLMYDLVKRMIAPTSLQLMRCDSCSKLFS